MKFNDGDDCIVEDVHFWAGTNITTYPIADIVRNANRALDRVASLIMRFDGRWKWDDDNIDSLPIWTDDLVANQSDYVLSIGQLKIQRVRVKDPNGNWVTLTPADRDDLSDDELSATGTPCKYYKAGKSICPVPIPNYGSTDGLEVQAQRGPDYFTETDEAKEPGFASQFHRLISLYIALDYCEGPYGSESRAEKIRNRIGHPPNPKENDPGAGMEMELAEFYSERDPDTNPTFGVERTLEPF